MYLPEQVVANATPRQLSKLLKLATGPEVTLDHLRAIARDGILSPGTPDRDAVYASLSEAGYITHCTCKACRVSAAWKLTEDGHALLDSAFLVDSEIPLIRTRDHDYTPDLGGDIDAPADLKWIGWIAIFMAVLAGIAYMVSPILAIGIGLGILAGCFITAK